MSLPPLISRSGPWWAAAIVLCGSGFVGWPPLAAAELAHSISFLERYCVDCHSGDSPEAALDLQRLSATPAIEKNFHSWRHVLEMVEQKKMPPMDADQPSLEVRQQTVAELRDYLVRAAEDFAEDPGAVTLRRLSSAEYAYTIQDLTGLDLDIQRDFVSDAVGGEGFTNVGDAQFMQDSTLERYLSAAKRVAEHAVIGAGPLQFGSDPGETGFELSAIRRIQRIYREHGFRTAAGEGGEAFGLDRYERAFYVAWRYRHRRILGDPEGTLDALAEGEGIDGGFAEYIWWVLNDADRSFPTTEILERWQALPAPRAGDPDEMEIRAQCRELHALVQAWQNNLGENPDAKEEARILEENRFRVSETKPFEMNINWPEGTETAHVTFAVESADNESRDDTVVIWQRPEVQFRVPDQVLPDPISLSAVIDQPSLGRLRFGSHPRGGKIPPTDFVTVGTTPLTINLPIPNGARSAELVVTCRLDVEHGDDRIVRCTISQLEETDQGKSVSALLANPRADSFRAWKDGVLEFARLLPQISHREPAPSDRDPIPPPFDGTYNNPERNYFHSRVKYHRDDVFLVRHILNEHSRRELDQAWFDLLGSFDYHNAFMRLLREKYDLSSLPEIGELTPERIARLPAQPRRFVGELRQNLSAIEAAFRAAEPGHVEDVLRFANRAWRRPLQDAEATRLRQFYVALREQGMEHRPAIRTLLTRVLTAPAFLYRAEVRSEEVSPRPLGPYELANRLSYFLWSSCPDDRLLEAAASSRLLDPNTLVEQTRRMLRAPKARRLSAEFFGQWLGFYQFDQYRGVDPERFPEFDEGLRVAMHEQAVTFFEHVVRKDRPVSDILFADYTFLNHRLADHYGVKGGFETGTRKVVLDAAPQPGGLFGLGAVLTVTSAPRRTSPVKRGDWILRRILGTPVPPPPADAGSIPADDVLADGKTVRQRLEMHRRDSSCRNCHSRIDPLGFALEHFDAVGRRRDRYRDGQAIDASGTLSDGTQIDGFAGLQEYLKREQQHFHHTLATKLAGYAFGRGESISDVALIDQMVDNLNTDPRFSSLVESIVRSKQFRYRR